MDLKTVYADEQGNIVDAPQDFMPLARRGEELEELKPEEIIPLPKAADLMCLPSHMPLARYGEEILPITGHAVAAVLPSGYIVTHLPAYVTEEGEAEEMPNYPFAPVVAYKDQLYVAAQRLLGSFDNPFQQYNTRNLHKLVKGWQKEYPKNKLVEYMGALALDDKLYSAQDLFYQRGEVSLPLGRRKLASGYVEAESYPLNTVLKFNPSGAELAQVGAAHLQLDNVLTLGMDMLEDVEAAEERLENALNKMRQKTNKGKINLYSLGIAGESIARLADKLDFITVHLATALAGDYEKFYGAANLPLVEETLAMAKEKSLKVMLKIPYLAGYTDTEENVGALLNLLKKYEIAGVILNNPWFKEEAVEAIFSQELGNCMSYASFMKKLREAVPVASDLAAILKTEGEM